MEDMGVTAWFSDPVYGRYWRHYQQAMSWQQRHLRAYRKALHAAYGPAYYHWYPNTPQRYADWQHGESGGRTKEERVSAQAPVEELGQVSSEGEATDSEGEDESDSDSEIECDVSNMEITEELRQYFAQTERHRDELKKQQEAEEQQDSYVLDDQDLHRPSWHSTLPPSDRPGERRAAEMKKLYGKDAAKIQGMEAAMQLSFDRHCDKKRPKYWPVIPLKL